MTAITNTPIHKIQGKIEYPHVSVFPNRKQRRLGKQKNRFYGEGRNLPLTVTKTEKYLRSKQVIRLKEGREKTILHYIKR